MEDLYTFFKRREKATIRGCKSKLILVTAILCGPEELQVATHSVLLSCLAFASYVLEQFGVTQKLNGGDTGLYTWLTSLFSPRFPATDILQSCGSGGKTNKSMLVHNY